MLLFLLKCAKTRWWLWALTRFRVHVVDEFSTAAGPEWRVGCVTNLQSPHHSRSSVFLQEAASLLIMINNDNGVIFLNPSSDREREWKTDKHCWCHSSPPLLRLSALVCNVFSSQVSASESCVLSPQSATWSWSQLLLPHPQIVGRKLDIRFFKLNERLQPGAVTWSLNSWHTNEWMDGRRMIFS